MPMTIEIKIHPIRDGEKASAAVIIDRRRADSWARESTRNMVSGDASERMTILLEDDQRIIFEGSSNMETVYDKEQNAAVPREKAPPPPLEPAPGARPTIDMTKGPQSRPLPYREDHPESLADMDARQHEEAKRASLPRPNQPIQPRPHQPATPTPSHTTKTDPAPATKPSGAQPGQATGGAKSSLDVKGGG